MQPQLHLDAPALIGGWDMGFTAGPKFATEAFHDYYYEVDGDDVRPTRPAFDADGGYSGFGLQWTARKRFDRLWVGGFLRYDNLEGAVFEDSPLVETRHAVSAGIAISWVLWQSEQTIDVGPR